MNVWGHVLELTGVPTQSKEPHWPIFSEVETQNVSVEVQKLLEKAAVERMSDIPGYF